MAEYKSKYTGAQIDEALGKATVTINVNNLMSYNQTTYNSIMSSLNEGRIVKVKYADEEFIAEAGYQQVIFSNAMGFVVWDNSDKTAVNKSYQEQLISGTSIKTVNGQSILGSGDLVINGPVEKTTYLIPQQTSGVEYAGKTLCVIGDSVTAGVGVTKGTNDYGTLVANALGMTANNQGASGTVLCTGGHRGSNIGKLTVANCSAAIVTILMGVNDWDQAVKNGYFGGSLQYGSDKTYYTLGELGSSDTTTIYGAVKMWCEKIISLKANDAVKNTKFFFMTPLITSWNNSVGTSKSWDQSKTNIHGFTFRELCNAIIETCAVYKIPCLDMNKYSGIYWKSDDDTNTKTVGGDGIHPNAAGHELIANALIDYIKLNPTYMDGETANEYVLQNISEVLGTKLTYPSVHSETIIPLTNLSLSASASTLKVGETVTITPTFTPSNSTQKTITWTSSNNSIATVNNGVVTALKEGNVTITCTPIEASSLAKTVSLSITAATSTDLTQIVLSDTAVTVEQGKTKTITATLVPSNTTQTNVQWTSSDNNIATVVGNGLSCVVTAIGVGQCYITAKSTVNTSISAQCFFTTSASGGDEPDSGESYNVLLNSKATYDTTTSIIGGTSTNTTSLISANTQATALVNEPISNGMEVEVEAICKAGGAYVDANKAKWSIAMLGLSKTNVLADMTMNPYTTNFPVGEANVYLDQPGSSQAYKVQYMKSTPALGKVELKSGYLYPNGDTVMSVKVIFRKKTDGNIAVKVGDNDWFDYSSNSTINALQQYKDGVAAETVYFFTSGVGATQVKVNYIGAIR